MARAHRLDISELDFENIKGSLKRFLANQNEFKDYDFEGSSISILLDLLAYNTHTTWHTMLTLLPMKCF